MFLWKQLYEDLDKERLRRGLSWRKLAKQEEVTASSFTRISQEKPTTVENLIQLLKIVHSLPFFSKYVRKG